MYCPTKDSIKKAYYESGKEVQLVLRTLFPDVFAHQIKKGELYVWGSPSDGGSGLVVDMRDHYTFVNFRTGDVYLDNIPKGSTIVDLNSMLAKLQPRVLHNCYSGEISGPNGSNLSVQNKGECGANRYTKGEDCRNQRTKHALATQIKVRQKGEGKNS